MVVAAILTFEMFLFLYHSKVTYDKMKNDIKCHLKFDFEQLLPFRRSTSNIVILCRVNMEDNLLCIIHCVNVHVSG